jgi:transcription-repair coupling factor (superfamily II helicase)
MVRQGRRVIVTFPHQGEALRTQRLLRRVEPIVRDHVDALPAEPSLAFVVSPARRGFVWRDIGVALLPDTQVFRKRPPRVDTRLGRASSRSPTSVSATVVHEDHGVGACSASRRRTSLGSHVTTSSSRSRRGSAHVPHEQIAKVSRYIGADAKSPSLSKLGGKAWQNLKSLARASVRELAGELLALYAQRRQAVGQALDLTSDWFERLESSFPYRETDDQLQAIEAVKEDLEAGRPMDRLVCGDVGFGKTEVAVRAAFAVALNDRQTLVLCPTTILAEQHWNTFRERYRDFPVRVEMVSRFRSEADQTRVPGGVQEGRVDVLVGTHASSRATSSRRTSASSSSTKSSVSASPRRSSSLASARGRRARALRLPFPHAPHVALRLRDISIIETPPSGARPVRTTVGEYDEELITMALEREHAARRSRRSISTTASSRSTRSGRSSKSYCPGLRFLVAHGQMSEKELEERMHAFLAGDADVLVSTTIIESGIDIPQANTLVVERADALGLAQLYQIRGRVGRSDVLAHAYLFYPDASELTPEARARLSTLADHTELGSGFQIAMRDLEIRGAGDLLGAEQSGHVAALGFELYVEMLDEAIAELMGRRRAVARPVRVDARVDAYVPAAYVAAEALKIDLHRRIALSEDEDELRELVSATEDRYGPLPEPVENLFAIQEAKLKLARLGADYLVFRGGRVTVGPLALGSAEVRSLVGVAPTLIYSTQKREVSLRVESLKDALELPDAIVEARLAA